ncbi:MAG TPA: DUF2087 domain-containing protein, partial [Nitrolancea sp.]
RTPFRFRRIVMHSDEIDDVQRLARAFADPIRLRVAAALLETDATPDQLATRLKLRPADIARQLAYLRDSGFVTEQVVDATACYAFDLNELRRASHAAFASSRSAGPEIDGDAWEQKTLRAFVKDERLIAIPAGRKKLLVILDWLATLFEPDVDYPEREVNEILARYHPDFATLRRDLVDNGCLTRDHGIYRRCT